jgi:hypothetical protein
MDHGTEQSSVARRKGKRQVSELPRKTPALGFSIAKPREELLKDSTRNSSLHSKTGPRDAFAKRVAPVRV